jgi:hypothetical protein
MNKLEFVEEFSNSGIQALLGHIKTMTVETKGSDESWEAVVKIKGSVVAGVKRSNSKFAPWLTEAETTHSFSFNSPEMAIRVAVIATITKIASRYMDDMGDPPERT